MSNLLSIIYVSSATHLFSNAELEGLLLEAGTFNKAKDVSGVLLYCDGNFMQCIEGPEESVKEVYSLITGSRRHKGLIEIQRAEIEERSFESWAMGFASPRTSEFSNLSHAISSASATDSPAPASDSVQILKNFVSVASRF
jgi:hypothetical protein